MTDALTSPAVPTDPAPSPTVAAVRSRSASPFTAALKRAARRPAAIFGFTWILLVVVASVLAPWIAPYDPLEQDVLGSLELPSSAHLLGTDDLGRDILSRLLYGGGELLATSLESVVVATLIGVPLGLLAGYIGRRTDGVTSFVMNIVLSVPGFVVLVAIVVASENNLWIVMAVLGVLFSANFFRLVRSSTLAARRLPYVEAAEVSAIPLSRIIGRHVLPNVLGPLVVQFFLTLSVAVIIASSLSFLGLGVSPEEPSWGQMTYDATQNLNTHPWMMVPVGLALILTILSFNAIGSSLRDALPHAQRGRLLVPVRLKRRRPPQSKAAADQLSPVDDQDFLQVRELTVSFPTESGGEQAVVDRVSFGIGRGQTLGIVGESGCGKTMTSLALLGLVPPPGQITAGTVRLGEQVISDLPEKQLAGIRGDQIGFVAQEPMVALDPCFKIGQLLKEPLRHHRGLRGKAADAAVLELLQHVGIARPEEVAASYPHQISGGMAQRVGIALAIAGHPQLLVADEPTTALDVTIQAEILDLMVRLQGELGMTTVIVTHDLGVVADVCDKVVVMYAGQIIEAGPVAQVLTSPSHPYTQALLDALPDAAPAGQPLPTVAGKVPLPKDWPASCRFADRCGYVTDDCRAGAIPLLPVDPEQQARCVRISDMKAAAR